MRLELLSRRKDDRGKLLGASGLGAFAQGDSRRALLAADAPSAGHG
jgi:hypothetical protein